VDPGFTVKLKLEVKLEADTPEGFRKAMADIAQQLREDLRPEVLSAATVKQINGGRHDGSVEDKYEWLVFWDMSL
jgi:hypothetical protein